MWRLALWPFFAQAVVMLFDEFYFHVRRGLPKWERWGHPLDTLTVLACMAYVIWVPFSKAALPFYMLLALFSSVFVTKDEFVHKHHCPASEQWLHALLFTLHPITLACAGLLWPVAQGIEMPTWLAWLNQSEEIRLFLYLQFGVMGLFCMYQVVFWNMIYDQQ